MKDSNNISSKKLIPTQYVQINQVSTFQALRELRQLQNHHQQIKNRITVLKVQDQKNIRKLQTQKNRINKILNIRDSNLRDKQRKSQIKRQIIKQTEKHKSYNRQVKQKQKQNNNKIKKSIFQNKINTYKHQCQKRALNQEKVIKDKQSILIKNKILRNKIVDMEQQHKQNILNFVINKNHTIHQSVLAQKNIYLIKKKKKQKQVSKVSSIQMQMMKKHSQSQLAYKETKDKLDSILGNIRKTNKQNKSKMKSILINKHPQTSFYGQ